MSGPDLGPTREAQQDGAEPADALHTAPAWTDGPAPEDEADTAIGAAEWRQALAGALAADREPRAGR